MHETYFYQFEFDVEIGELKSRETTLLPMYLKVPFVMHSTSVDAKHSKLQSFKLSW